MFGRGAPSRTTTTVAQVKARVHCGRLFSALNAGYYATTLLMAKLPGNYVDDSYPN